VTDSKAEAQVKDEKVEFFFQGKILKIKIQKEIKLSDQVIK
jgi:hypothetical protein